MAESSSIEWTVHTFNPWRGCSKVSPGCQNCYAEATATRNPAVLGVWGPNGTRPIAADSGWSHPLKWDRQAARTGERPRVFCASMADVFEDRPDVLEARDRLWRLIEGTPHLDWLLVTKRPQNATRLTPASWQTGWPAHVWLGVSVEDQRRAEERIQLLLEVPTSKRWLSCEPLLESLDLSPWLAPNRVGWVVAGGESGPEARRCQVEWIRSLVQQCDRAGIPPFVKQVGDNPNPDGLQDITLIGKKGGNIDAWPEDLQRREYPRW